MVTRAVQPRASSPILPCSSIRRSGTTGGYNAGAVLRSFPQFLTSSSVRRGTGRSNRESGAGKGRPLRTSYPYLLNSRRSRRGRGVLARNRRMSRDTPSPLARPRPSGMGGSLPRHNTRCTLRPPSHPAHLKGGKKKKRKSKAAKLPKEFLRG